jgi:hypothetical protein
MTKRILVGIAVIFIGTIGLSHADVLTEKLGSDEIKIPIPTGYYRYDGKSDAIDTYYNGLTTRNRIVAMFCNEQDLISVLNDTMPPLDRAYSVQVAKSFENLRISDYDFSLIIRDTENKLTLLVEDSQGISKDIGKKSSLGFSEMLKKQIDSKLTGLTNLGFFDKESNSICTLSIGKFKVAEPGGDVLLDRINVIALCMINLNGKVVNLLCVAKCQDKNDIEWTKSEIRKWRDDWIKVNPKKSLPVAAADKSISRKARSQGLTPFAIGEIFGRIVGWIVIVALILTIILAVRWLAGLLRRRPR